jgi:Fe2+ transport system protein FeoA
MTTLANIHKGQQFVIKGFLDDAIALAVGRLGFAQGALVSVSQNIPKGPIILKRFRQEIALGRDLAQSIVVEPII